MTSCPLAIMMGEWVQHVGPSTWVIWPKHTHTHRDGKSFKVLSALFKVFFSVSIV